MKNAFLFQILLFLISCSKAPLFDDPKVENGDRGNARRERINPNDLLAGYSFDMKWALGPRIESEGESKLNLFFWDSNKGTNYGPFLIPEKKVCIFLWMVMPDGSEHGSAPVQVKKVNSEDGSYYEISEMYFVMNGAWQVRIRAVPDHTTCKTTKDFPYEEEVILAININ